MLTISLTMVSDATNAATEIAPFDVETFLQTVVPALVM